MAYPKLAFKKIKPHVPYMITFDHVIDKPGLINDAGHYVFNAVCEFQNVGSRNVLVVAVEDILRHMTPLAESWYLGEPSKSGVGFIRLEQLCNLKSIRLFPKEHLPLLITWEKRYPRYEQLFKE
jgi:hypothetical protein